MSEFKTITQGDVTITLKLNDNGSVNLFTKMDVDYPNIDDSMRSIYPDAGSDNIGTIQDQFDYIASSRAFDETYHRRKLGERIKEIREAAGMSQDEVAEKAGLQRPNLSRIENGRHNPSHDTLNRIAEVLGKKLDLID